MPTVTAPDRATAAVFRPTRGRWVSTVLGVATLVGSVLLALGLPEQTGLTQQGVAP